jgi:hypothetical protein
MSGINIPNSERAHVGEALIVYIYRALGKPSRSAYFHVRLLDVLVKCANDSFRLALGIAWASNTSYLKKFDKHSVLDEHPDAPQWAAAQAFSKGECFVFLSAEGIARIKAMTREKRRQLEAIACELFPDHEAIRGTQQLYSGASVPKKDSAYLTSEAERHVENTRPNDVLQRCDEPLGKLEVSIGKLFDSPTLSKHEAERLHSELDDLLIGRLELEQPLINVELLARVMARALKRLSETTSSVAMEGLAQKALAALAIYFPVLKYATA